MSRIGKLPINIPAGVNVTFTNNLVTVKGPKGELKQDIHPEIGIVINDGQIKVERPSDAKEHRSMHGLYRSLVNNMVTGVTEGFTKKMELVGVGYRASNTNQVLELSLGYSHAIQIELPAEVKVETVTDRKSNPIITLQSIDKQLLGQICAKIRSLRSPEPYKGKGIRFVGEIVRRKAGKRAKV